jgi:hypothetical protein
MPQTWLMFHLYSECIASIITRTSGVTLLQMDTINGLHSLTFSINCTLASLKKIFDIQNFVQPQL